LNPLDLPALPKDRDGPVFAAPWEAQAFAMAVELNEKGVFTWVEWAETISAEIKAADRPYYEHWLAALEALVESRRLLSRAEREARIAAWDEAARHTPHGQPILLRKKAGGAASLP
jgi:nitrile hydratase accessory protein